MIKNKVILIVAALIVVAGVFSYIAYASEYGTPSDPLVTLSYIQKVVIPGIMKDVEDLVNKKIDEYKSTIPTPTETPTPTPTATPTPTPEPLSASYVVVTVKAGQTLLAAAEGTEVILRSGEAVVVAPLKNQGISNVTQGKDALADEKVIKNNLYIIPRADGRGVKVSTDCYFMVRGAFKIVS